MEKVINAQNVVILGAIAAASIIIIQIWRLHDIWLAIKYAENIDADSRSKMSAISENIQQLTVWATELRDLMNESETANGDQATLMRTIRTRIRRSHKMYTDTRVMLGKLHLKVDGKQQVLAVYQLDQMGSAVVNGAHGITNLIQCFQFSGLLGTGLTVLQGGITTAFFGLAAANLGMYHATGEALAELRKILEQIDALEGELDRVGRTIDEAEDWIEINDPSNAL